MRRQDGESAPRASRAAGTADGSRSSMGSHLSGKRPGRPLAALRRGGQDVVDVVGVRRRSARSPRICGQVALEARSGASCELSLPDAATSAVVGSVAIATRIWPSARWSRDFAVPSGMPRESATSRARHPQVVVHDDERARSGSSRRSARVEEVAIGDQRGSVAHGRPVEGSELHLDDPPPAVPRGVDTGMHGQAMQPGIEPVGVA